MPDAFRDSRPALARALPPWLSLACAHPQAYRTCERYLRYLAPGLDHLGPEPARLEVHVATADTMPRIPSHGIAVGTRHGYEVIRLGSQLIYAVAGRSYVRIEPRRGAAALWTTDIEPAVMSELMSITVLELAAYRGFFGLHAGAVERDGTGYLLPGASGSGKSSLCLALTRAGFRYVTDDFVLLKADGRALRCVPFFRTFNIDAAWVQHFPELSFVGDLPPLPRGKRMFDPQQCYPGSHSDWARPAVLVFPTIVARARSELRRLTTREAFCRLLPQSRVSADPPTAEAHLRTLAMLARASEAFDLHHGRDFPRRPMATVRRLVASLEREPAVATPR